MNEDQQLIQFLMGLNDVYTSVRGNLLMMKPPPTTGQAYSIVLHEESQREVPSLLLGKSGQLLEFLVTTKEQFN